MTTDTERLLARTLIDDCKRNGIRMVLISEKDFRLLSDKPIDAVMQKRVQELARPILEVLRALQEQEEQTSLSA